MNVQNILHTIIVHSHCQRRGEQVIVHIAIHTIVVHYRCHQNRDKQDGEWKYEDDTVVGDWDIGFRVRVWPKHECLEH